MKRAKFEHNKFAIALVNSNLVYRTRTKDEIRVLLFTT